MHSRNYKRDFSTAFNNQKTNNYMNREEWRNYQRFIPEKQQYPVFYDSPSAPREVPPRADFPQYPEYNNQELLNKNDGKTASYFTTGCECIQCISPEAQASMYRQSSLSTYYPQEFYTQDSTNDQQYTDQQDQQNQQDSSYSSQNQQSPYFSYKTFEPLQKKRKSLEKKDNLILMRPGSPLPGFVSLKKEISMNIQNLVEDRAFKVTTD